MSIGQAEGWQDSVRQDVVSIIRGGGIFVGFFAVLFLFWATLFPLANAVVISGSIVASGDNKLLQHPTGGVVRAIFVSDGELVKKGDIILSIDPVVSQAERTSLVARQTMLIAQKSRLEAEKSSGEGVEETGLPLRGKIEVELIFGLSEVEENAVYAEQRREFIAGRTRYDSQVSSARHQIESLKQDRRGVALRRDGVAEILGLNRLELARMRPLAEAGYVAMREVWVLERTVGEQGSQYRRAGAELASLAEKIGEAEQRLAQLVSGEQARISQELSEVLTQLAGISDQLRAADSAVEAADIRAPIDGILVNLSAKTIGGVVSGFATLGEIVPRDAGLIAKGRVRPQDVAQVQIGQVGEVVITAFNARRVEPISAEVIYISADSLLDEKSGETYFEVRLRPDEMPEAAAKIAPGMQADIFLKGSSRTFMTYALTPLMDSFRRAFLER